MDDIYTDDLGRSWRIAPDGTMVKCKLIHAGLILGTTRNPEATVTYL
jgi:hypothetical protein